MSDVDSRLKAFRDEQLENLTHALTMKDSFEATINKLASLPEKPEHDVLVPFGKMAFFPGKIVKTDSAVSHIGCEFYVKKKIPSTVVSLNRHLEIISNQVEMLRSACIQVDEQIAGLHADAIANLKAGGKGTVREDMAGNMVIEEEELSSESEFEEEVPEIESTIPVGECQKEPSSAELLARLEKLEDEAGEDEEAQRKLLMAFRAARAREDRASNKKKNEILYERLPAANLHLPSVSTPDFPQDKSIVSAHADQSVADVSTVGKNIRSPVEPPPMAAPSAKPRDYEEEPALKVLGSTSAAATTSNFAMKPAPAPVKEGQSAVSEPIEEESEPIEKMSVFKRRMLEKKLGKR